MMFGAEADELLPYEARHPIYAPYYYSIEESAESRARSHARRKHDEFVAQKQREP